MEDEKQFLSVEEFAACSGLSIITVRRYAKLKHIPSIQPAGPRGRMLIPRKALDDLATLAFSEVRNLDESKADIVPNSIPGRKPKWRQTKTHPVSISKE